MSHTITTTFSSSIFLTYSQHNFWLTRWSVYTSGSKRVGRSLKRVCRVKNIFIITLQCSLPYLCLFSRQCTVIFYKLHKVIPQQTECRSRYENAVVIFFFSFLFLPTICSSSDVRSQLPDQGLNLGPSSQSAESQPLRPPGNSPFVSF